MTDYWFSCELRGKMNRLKAVQQRCRIESLVLCDSSVQQNTGSTNKSLTYQGQETITVLQKEYKLSLDQMLIAKNKTHTNTILQLLLIYKT